MIRLADIEKPLPDAAGKAPLISGVRFVRVMRFQDSKSQGVLVVDTPRQLTPDGGDGCNGVDGIDMNAINAALVAAVEEAGHTGTIDRFIIREKTNVRIEYDVDTILG